MNTNEIKVGDEVEYLGQKVYVSHVDVERNEYSGGLRRAFTLKWIAPDGRVVETKISGDEFSLLTKKYDRPVSTRDTYSGPGTEVITQKYRQYLELVCAEAQDTVYKMRKFLAHRRIVHPEGHDLEDRTIREWVGSLVGKLHETGSKTMWSWNEI